MGFILDNWYVFLAFGAVLFVAGYKCAEFFKKPSQEQIEALKKWLLYAVTIAEKKFGGGGTGSIKLRYVYDLFLSKFPWLAKLITFERFSELVDVALKEMRELIETNAAIKNLDVSDIVFEGVVVKHEKE